MVIKRNIPLWCLSRFHGDLNKDNKVCCYCGSDLRFHQSNQEGDGKVIHTLCKTCYIRIQGMEIIKSKMGRRLA